jgi:hypothetical protein
MSKKVVWIASPNEDAQGATHRASLGDEILAFVYPVAARRIYSTFFCPPLRIVAIDEKKHLAVFDQVVQPSRFVALPATRLVLEMDPGVDYVDLLPGILEKISGQTHSGRGEIESEVSASALVFALFADALADLRRVKSVCIVNGEVDPAKLKTRFAPWERGKIVGSAGFVIDYSDSVTWRIPAGAIELSHQALQIEKDYHDELLAASAAGLPWQAEFPNKCMRCGKGGSWRFALPIPPGMPVEISWRLERPENAVLLCHNCVETTRFSIDEHVRRDLAWALWGARFDALERWYMAARNLNGCRLPKDWSRESYPLWPKEFGGTDWASGSGATKHCVLRDPKNVRRTPKQQKTLTKILRLGV